MRIFIIIGVVASIFVGYILFQSHYSLKINQERSLDDKTQQLQDGTIQQFSGEVERSIFVPYWNIPERDDDLSEYETLIYFGIAPDKNGNLNMESGMLNVESFIESTPSSSERLLTVRMLDTENNLEILESNSKQQTTISETLQIVEKYGFDGIVLDLEVGVLPLGEIKSSISSFVRRFTDEVHEADISFSLTVYGDVFYRARPYDVEALAKNVDKIYIMAYDFHKSRGEPGPNFPFNNNEEYGYDFRAMIDDYTGRVPREKITVIFGMYGYDWTLGPKSLPLKAAQSISLREIEEEIVPYCKVNGSVGLIPFFLASSPKGLPAGKAGDYEIAQKKISSLASSVFASEPYSDCILYKDKKSHEKNITYTDSEGYDHVLWFEDKDSAEIKTEYLKEQGIGSVGYWVWGYW